MDDMGLLREYAINHSETAFAELVSRRIGFVYSAALRQVRDEHLAGEITQAVFILLAQKAGRISGKTILGGWLFRTTRFAALAQMRAAAKRQRLAKELQMQTEPSTTAPDPLWEQLSPRLDEALAALGEQDRQAVLLRYFENKSLAEVGAVLGTSEDTARKRTARALAKLHRYFGRLGISSTTAILAGAISSNSVQAAPMALTKSVAAVSIGKGAASGSTLTLIKGALKIMAWTKAKTTVVVGVWVLLAVGTASITVKELARPVPDESWRVRYFDSRVLDKASPQVKILPAKYPPGGYGSSGDAWMGVGTAVKAIVDVAYRQSPARSVFPVECPGGDYDFIVKLPPGARPQDVSAALQAEVKRAFGLVGHLETRNTDVLMLAVKNPGAAGLRPGVQQNNYSSFMKAGELSVANNSIRILADDLENYFQLPIIDQTGITGTFNIHLKWDEPDWKHHNANGLKQAMRDQLGLELVPTNLPIEMLVVEKVK